jgi:hypothetical protein
MEIEAALEGIKAAVGPAVGLPNPRSRNPTWWWRGASGVAPPGS